MTTFVHPGRILTHTVGGIELAKRDAAGNLIYSCCAGDATCEEPSADAVDIAITKITEAESDDAAALVCRALTLSTLRAVADQIDAVDYPDGHGRPYLTREIVKAARA